MITGLGSKTFEDALTSILHVHSLFADILPANTLQELVPRRSGGTLELEFSNRYFANGDNPSTEDYRPLDNVVDPLRILSNLCPSQLTSSDNEVLYFERCKHASGYVTITPTPDVVVNIFHFQASSAHISHAQRDTTRPSR